MVVNAWKWVSLVLVSFAMAGCSLKPPGTGAPTALSSSVTPTPTPTPSANPSSPSYVNDLKPVMDQFCVSCHGASMAMGNIRLDTYTQSGLTQSQNLSRWLDAYNAIKPLGDMPPSGPAPSSSQLAMMKAWLDAGIPEYPASASPSPTPTPTSSPLPSPTPSVSPTPYPSPTICPTPSPSVPPSPSPTPSPTPVPSEPPPPPPANQPPVTVPLALSTISGVPVPINLWARDPENGPLLYTLSKPAHGVLSGKAPNQIYTPEANFAGSESLIFTVVDSGGLKSSSTVKVMIFAPQSNSEKGD